MVKVNNGWQSHSIDQVETLASHAGSPTSSTSTTINLRRPASSASPQLSSGSTSTTPAPAFTHHFPPNRPSESTWSSSLTASPAVSSEPSSSLAPAVSIQPSREQHAVNPRRNSNPRQPPALVSGSHQTSPVKGPHTPSQPSPYTGHGHPPRTSFVDPILFSPHQTPHQAVREQDAMEALLFMSSPGNSANLKHAFPAVTSTPGSSQPTSTPRTRTALPNSQPRKSLPSGRVNTTATTSRRVGFDRSPGAVSEMDIDSQPGTPHTSGTPRRRPVNGSQMHSPHGRNTDASARRVKQFSLPAALGTTQGRRRPVLADEDIDRMLETAASPASDSDDDEILIPVPSARASTAAR
jgi:hypothetical protein